MEQLTLFPLGPLTTSGKGVPGLSTAPDALHPPYDYFTSYIAFPATKEPSNE